MAEVGAAAEEGIMNSYQKRGRRKAVSAAPPRSDTEFKRKVIPKTEDEAKKISTVIDKSILFSHLDKEQRGVVLDAMFTLSYQPGEVIIKQGDEGDNFYIIDSGVCEIFVQKTGEDPILVMTVKDGDSFGELALMYDARRAATVKAKTVARLWAVDRDTYKHILMQSAVDKRNMYEGFLENVPILASLDKYERLRVADALHPVYFKAGVNIINEGDSDAETFYIIEDGEVICTQIYDPSKPPGELCRLSRGQYFGEKALLQDTTRAATVTSLTDCKCLSLNRSTFNMVLGPLMDILKRNAGSYQSYVEMNKGAV